MEKIINHVGITMFEKLKNKVNLVVKMLLHKDVIGLARKGNWKYRFEVGMLCYFEVSTRPESSMLVYQCTRLSINI